MPFKVKAKIEGLGPVLKRLEGLKQSMQRSIVKKAVDAAGKAVLDAVKPLVPKDTGLLLKSMGRKVVIGRRSGVAIAIVGPRTGFKVIRLVDRNARTATGFALTKSGKVRKVVLSRRGTRSAVGSNPTQYAHLVELGRKGFRAKGRALLVQGIGFRASVGPSAGTKFMERGLASARGRIVGAMASVIQEGLTKQGR